MTKGSLLSTASASLASSTDTPPGMGTVVVDLMLTPQVVASIVGLFGVTLGFYLNRRGKRIRRNDAYRDFIQGISRSVARLEDLIPERPLARLAFFRSYMRCDGSDKMDRQARKAVATEYHSLKSSLQRAAYSAGFWWLVIPLRRLESHVKTAAEAMDQTKFGDEDMAKALANYGGLHSVARGIRKAKGLIG